VPSGPASARRVRQHANSPARRPKGRRQAKSLAPLILLLCALPATAQKELHGAGATFPEPLYTKWFAAFGERRPEIRIHYEGVGSEEGIRRLAEGKADFAGSDMPLDDEQLAKLGRPVLQLPSAIGAVVPIYHIEGVAADLRFTPAALAGIFLGRIKQWNDPAIQADNRGVRLPNRAIRVVHRSDGSGTTFVWTDYLSKVSAEWKAAVGTGTSVAWPTGQGAAGNEGVARQVSATPDSIGYVEFIFALRNHLSYGTVRNAAGRFVAADLDSIAAAATNAAPGMPANFWLSITNAPGRDAYPIASFTYLLADLAKNAFMRDLLEWILTSGQRQSAGLGYGSLPPEIVAREQQAIRELQ
jgi:phosphate transport system substrate-binding protein